MPLGAGKFRNYCAIQATTRTSDGQGGWTVTWATIVSEWLSAKPLSMSRALDQSGIKYKLAVEFAMKKRDDTPTDLYTLTGEHRIVWNSANYTIHSVVPSEKLDELKILAYV